MGEHYEMYEAQGFDKKEIISFLKDMDATPCKIGEFCEHKKPSKCKYCKICMKHIPSKNSSLNYMNNGFGFKDENGDVHKGLDLINEGYLRGNKRFEGMTLEVLVEGVDEQDASLLTGRLSNNILVHFPGDESLIGTFQNVKLNEAKGFYYLGERVE